MTRTPGGYEGKLEIFAADGKRIFTRNYDRSRSFWDLLGDMDVDAMAFLDVKPSGELADYLHQPRCKQPQSLIDLGSTAFMTESSPGAFDVYKKILEADPVFAMVRTWYANQKYVHDRDFRSEAASWASRFRRGSMRRRWRTLFQNTVRTRNWRRSTSIG